MHGSFLDTGVEHLTWPHMDRVLTLLLATDRPRIGTRVVCIASLATVAIGTAVLWVGQIGVDKVVTRVHADIRGAALAGLQSLLSRIGQRVVLLMLNRRYGLIPLGKLAYQLLGLLMSRFGISQILLLGEVQVQRDRLA